jgi:hypothetical protein
MNKTSGIKWQDSIGKKYLINDLRSGLVPITGGDVKAIYAMRTEFGGNDPNQLRLFPSRLKSARKQVQDRLHRAASGAASLQHDRQIYPKHTFNHLNKLRWQGSTAENLLKIDIQRGKHKEMKPIELYQSQEEYQKFPLDVFRGHIHQEVQRIKFVKQYGSRRK